MLLQLYCRRVEKCLMKKVVFITGTRADFGKLKPLIRASLDRKELETHVYVSGMHLLKTYGNTYREILREDYPNVRLQKNRCDTPYMDLNLARLTEDLSAYVREIQPDLIVVHGDRIDAMAGAIVAMLNGIRLGHVEGGEVTGTVDEAIRHAISKMANVHFVANSESFLRLRQMGEDERNIFVIGSPDIDVMLSDELPELDAVKQKYQIPFREYAVLIHHPVTSELDRLAGDIQNIMRALEQSGDDFIAIYPNNDSGTKQILSCYAQYQNSAHFRFFPSLPFEVFLTFLKNAKYIVGNSSCGVREACVYGVPAIDIGTRQKNRYAPELLPNIQHVEADTAEVLRAIADTSAYRVATSYFGDGHSAERFGQLLKEEKIWNTRVQKCFLDAEETKRAIQVYHNEVCF